MGYDNGGMSQWDSDQLDKKMSWEKIDRLLESEKEYIQKIKMLEDKLERAMMRMDDIVKILKQPSYINDNQTKPNHLSPDVVVALHYRDYP